MSASGAPCYSVVITTFRRPRAVIAAAQSVLAQDAPPSFELIIVDNDPDGSGLKPARRLRAEAGFPVRVIHERRIGLHAARNAGVEAARGEFVAFLDDNQVVSPRWLKQLAEVQQTTQAGLVFGAVHVRMQRGASEHSEFYKAYFSRDPDHREGLIDQVYDCRCSLIRRDLLKKAGPFVLDAIEDRDAVDPALLRLRDHGPSIAWAASAWVWQAPQREQLSLKYALRSAYNLSRECAKQAVVGGRRRLRSSALNLLSGAGLVLGAGPAALAMFCVRSRRRAFMYRRLVDGLGRLLWASAFRLSGPDRELMPVAG